MTENKLIEPLAKLGYKTKHISKTRVAVLTDENRSKILNEIATKVNGVYDSSRTDSSSSVGWVQLNDHRIYAKPASRQGAKSAGIENEMMFVESINQCILQHGPIDVNIKDVKISSVINCQEVGRSTSGRRKADVILETTSGDNVPISIKKHNAEIWESGDKLFRDLLYDIATKAKAMDLVKLTRYNDISYLSNSIATVLPEDIQTDVVFGSDLLDTPVGVVFKTFEPKDFTFDPSCGTLTVDVDRRIGSLQDLISTSHEPYLLIRNDSTRRGTRIPGLRALAVAKSRINKNVVLIT